jgi:iron complex outermembrane recepter protein
MKSKRPCASRFVAGGALGFIFFALWLVGCPAAALAQTNQAEPWMRLKQLSLEQLMNEEVTTVSRQPEKLSQSPSAVQVITDEDIRRSGATSLPEALRLAPNLEVAQVNSHDWAISARGFNNTLANKLLVMIDGRTVYTPLYAGVFWDAQNPLLVDVDRIEVVSGPGGTLWGANAVNGVINVVTKSARDTQGLWVQGAGGSSLQDFSAVRYGGTAGSNWFYRVYGQRFDRYSTLFPNGQDAGNHWNMNQGGFRVDGYPSDGNTVTFQGDYYGGSEDGLQRDTTLDGQNVLGRWSHVISDESDFRLQFYFDRTWRNIPSSFAEDLKTYDIDFQYRFTLGQHQNFLWGAGYRLMQDAVQNSPFLAFLPPDRNLQLFSAFVQDQIALVPDRLVLTLGSKLEHNDYSGFEVQPSGRLLWTPTDGQAVWAAISRAVRSPSRIDTDVSVPAPPVAPGITNLQGSPFEAEKELAYELGYRVLPTERLSLSVAGFYNHYDQLRSLTFINPTTGVIANDFRGETYGVELSGDYQPTEWWRLRGGYTWMQKHLWTDGKPNVDLSVREGDDPQNQFLLQSMMDLPANFQLDLVGRYVDTLPSPPVPSYFTFDARLAWHHKNIELEVVGQNLWDNRHTEFGAPGAIQEIPRSVYGRVTWRF